MPFLDTNDISPSGIAGSETCYDCDNQPFNFIWRGKRMDLSVHQLQLLVLLLLEVGILLGVVVVEVVILQTVFLMKIGR